jgi:hypothetical protein
MMFFRMSQRPVSRRTNFARPAVEGCEARQLMSGFQAGADVTSMRKHISEAVPALMGQTVGGTVHSDATGTNSLAGAFNVISATPASERKH